MHRWLAPAAGASAGVPAQRGLVACRRRTFTETSAELPPPHRLTGRLRAKLKSARRPGRPGRVRRAAEYGMSWWSVQHALVVTAAGLLPGLRVARHLDEVCAACRTREGKGARIAARHCGDGEGSSSEAAGHRRRRLHRQRGRRALRHPAPGGAGGRRPGARAGSRKPT